MLWAVEMNLYWRKNVHYFYDSTILADFESMQNLNRFGPALEELWIQNTRFEKNFMIKLVPLKSGPT